MNKAVYKITTFLLVIIFTFSSCGKKAEENDQKLSIEENVKVIVEFKSQLNDKFEVYYTTDAEEIIKGDKKIDQFVYGSNEMQKIEIQFPKGVKPYNVRLDVGSNPDLEFITIKNISIKFKDKLLDGDLGKFMTLFNLYTESITFNSSKCIFEVFPKNGVKDPFLYANDVLNQKLVRLYK